jgi:diguanylate cyclase (GGDEF)-like protein
MVAGWFDRLLAVSHILKGAMPMNEIKPHISDPTITDVAREIQPILRKLDRKAWWHWWTAVLVILLLTGGIISLSLPKTFGEGDPNAQLQLGVAVRGLLGLVLIFNVYTLYQQHLLTKLRKHLASQIEVATQQKMRAEGYYELAFLDSLTGLYNRRYIEDHLRSEMAQAVRRGEPLVILLMDLDDFKQINDRFGHLAGDLVLQEFARRLNKAIRGSDVAVRLGGDEFLAVLSECPPDKVAIVLSRLTSFEVEVGGQKISVSASRGWAQYRVGDSAQDLIKRADEALYEHKAVAGSGDHNTDESRDLEVTAT